jgi:hypothetical protein
MGVQLPRHAPIYLRVGKSGNPPDLESGDRWIEASHADHICLPPRRGQAGGTSGALLRRAHLYGCRDRIPVSPPELRESYKGITSRFQRDDRISSIRSRSNFSNQPR